MQIPKMTMDSKGSQYGLIKFSKNSNKTSASKVVLGKPSIFGADSDSDEAESVPPQFESSNLKKQTKSNIQKAIDIDPTIFQYDEVYDQIKASQNKDKFQAKVEAKPKYISNLLKAAEARKREQEIRFERKIQKEREKEGDEFKDKESFVTSSYREKLEEMRKTHEELERQDKIDNMLDVTKQADLSGFYRGLYSNSLFNDNSNEPDNKGKEKIVFNKSSVRNKISIRETIVHDENKDDEELKEESPSILPKNDNIVEQPKEEPDKKIETKLKEPSNRNEQLKQVEENNDQDKELEKDQEVKVKSEPKLTRAQMIEKIFTKRTVGVVFEEARKRYLERKRLRELN